MENRNHYGDDGYTFWLGSGRIRKTDPRIEAVGDIDEAQAAIALCLALLGGGMAEELSECISDLRVIMAQIMSPVVISCMLAFDLQRLDLWEAELNARVGTTRGFYTPGVNPTEAQLNFARTVVRRAERHCHLITSELPENFGIVTAYLNRLSSILFLLSQVKV